MYKKPHKFPSYRGRPRWRRNKKHRSFDPSFFVRKAEQQPQEVYVSKHAFSDFMICPELKKNILDRGYTVPTPIQDQAIPVLLKGKDVIGIANTGTGKTAAFLIPLINKVFYDKSQKVLILTPTRELAVQIEKEFIKLAKRLNIYSTLCIGGVRIGNQIRGLRRNPHFVIGTPGRMQDLEKRGHINFASYSTIVLDEVDRMLDMGFVREVGHIISRLSRNRHSLFFSATTQAKVRKIMERFIHEPVTISVKSRDTLANIDQSIIRMGGKTKIGVLRELLQHSGFGKVLVFVRTKRGVEKIARDLNRQGFKVATIHSNKNQNQRQRALERFRHNNVQVLLATDVASRGLDIDNITHVINYDLPGTYEDYVNRIGRTGRASKKGVALTFVE